MPKKSFAPWKFEWKVIESYGELSHVYGEFLHVLGKENKVWLTLSSLSFQFYSGNTLYLLPVGGRGKLLFQLWGRLCDI